MKTVVVAEDNQDMATLCRRELEDEGYRVLVVHDGARAVQVVRDQSPHVVVLDIAMPGVSGLQALEQIREDYPDLPVILFTGYDEDCVTDQRARLATACIDKSADLAELKRAIVRALAYGSLHEASCVGLPQQA